jgi:menaquinone-dependent protoporphyrinogen oxidase
MKNKILITYASRTGSTQGVAEVIAKTFTEKGMSVDLYPMQEVKDLAAYQALVAGSAIQNRQWLPEAMQFLQTHRAAMTQIPVATFTLCMTLAIKNGEKYLPDIMEWLAPVRRIARPVSQGVFAGVLDISKITSFSDRLKFRLSVLFGVWTEGDHRDWDAIHAWADELPSKFFNHDQMV